MDQTSRPYDVGNSSVSIEVGDITSATAQVIVSSDDDHLSMSGGVSRALLKAGGEAIREEARKKQTPIEVGKVVVTGAGTLGAQHIFHAITRRDGERRSTDAEKNRQIIASATTDCLQLVRRMGLKSIAFPAIGAGYAGFSVADVAVEMATAIRTDLTLSPEPLSVSLYLLQTDVKHAPYHEFFKRFDERTGMAPRVKRDHAVALLHGIRTEARWFERVRNLLLERAPQVDPVFIGYGWFGTMSFLLPIASLRENAIRRAKTKLDGVFQNTDYRHVSVIAHSFGTYIIGKILERTLDNPGADSVASASGGASKLKFHRLVLCGSILDESFAWEQLRDRVDQLPGRDVGGRRVINDCGWRDPWPVLAQWSTKAFKSAGRYGSAGRFGFKNSLVLDRYHDFGHSGFFSKAFVLEYWVPLFAENRVVENREERDESSWLTLVATSVGLTVLALIAVSVCALAYLLW